MGFARTGVFEELRGPGSCDQRVWDCHGGVKSPIDEVGALGQGEVATLPAGCVGNEKATFVVDGARVSEKSIKRCLQTDRSVSQNIYGSGNDARFLTYAFSFTRSKFVASVEW